MVKCLWHSQGAWVKRSVWTFELRPIGQMRLVASGMKGRLEGLRGQRSGGAGAGMATGGQGPERTGPPNPAQMC